MITPCQVGLADVSDRGDFRLLLTRSAVLLLQGDQQKRGGVLANRVEKMRLANPPSRVLRKRIT